MKFNKSLVNVFLLVATALTNNVVSAQDMRFYVGGDAEYNKYSHYASIKALNTSIKKNIPGFGFNLGMKFMENFAGEVGYKFYKDAKYTNNASNVGKYNVNNIYFDVLGMMPIDQQIDFVGALGFGRVKVEEKDNDSNNNGTLDKMNKVGFRLGAGMQYAFDANIAGRAMVRYQKIGSKSGKQFLKSTTSIGLGISYMF